MSGNQEDYFMPFRWPPKDYFSKKPSKAEAIMLLQRDYYYQNRVSESKYAKDWDWHRQTVHKFLADNFLSIKRANSRQEGFLEITSAGIALGGDSPIVNRRIRVQNKPSQH